MQIYYKQTVEISIPSLENYGVQLPLDYKIMDVPVAPPGVTEQTDADGSVTRWVPHCIYKITKDGVWYTWYSKPTLTEAIIPTADSSYYEFKPNGEVTYRYRGYNNTQIELWWSGPEDRPICTPAFTVTNTYETFPELPTLDLSFFSPSPASDYAPTEQTDFSTIDGPE